MSWAKCVCVCVCMCVCVFLQMPTLTKTPSVQAVVQTHTHTHTHTPKTSTLWLPAPPFLCKTESSLSPLHTYVARPLSLQPTAPFEPRGDGVREAGRGAMMKRWWLKTEGGGDEGGHGIFLCHHPPVDSVWGSDWWTSCIHILIKRTENLPPLQVFNKLCLCMQQAGLNAASEEIKLIGRKNYSLKLSSPETSMLTTKQQKMLTSHAPSLYWWWWWWCVCVCVLCTWQVTGSGQWKLERTRVTIYFLSSQALHRDALETLSSSLREQLAILCERLLGDVGRRRQRGADVRMHFSDSCCEDSFWKKPDRESDNAVLKDMTEWCVSYSLGISFALVSSSPPHHWRIDLVKQNQVWPQTSVNQCLL